MVLQGRPADGQRQRLPRLVARAHGRRGPQVAHDAPPFARANCNERTYTGVVAHDAPPAVCHVAAPPTGRFLTMGVRVHTWLRMLANHRILPLFAVALAAAVQAPRPLGGAPGPWPLEDEESFLISAQIESVEPAGKGVTHSLKALLSDGMRQHSAHIQTVDLYLPEFRGRDGSVETDFRDSWKFNVAAYRLARLLHLTNMVPVCIERPYQGKPAAFSWWVDNVGMDERERLARHLHPPDIPRWNRQMDIIRTFDQLIYNMDRSQENLLITTDWDVWMIDHTRAFRDSPTLRNPDAVLKCPPELLRWLKALRRSQVEQQMGDLLTPAEINGLMARRDLIAAKVESQAMPGAVQ